MISVPVAKLDHNTEDPAARRELAGIHHPESGALARARRGFLAGCGLPLAWQGRAAFTILETGFGIGLNFLAAWDAWRQDPGRARRLHFVSVEGRPFAREDLAAVLAGFDEVAPLAQALCGLWPPPLAGFHRLHFDGGHVMLTLVLGAPADCLPQMVARADALFLEGFGPAREASTWSPAVVRELARLAAPGATVATATIAGGVRSVLAHAGFRIEKVNAGGHEMFTGVRDGAAQAGAANPARRAAVIGGGLAGTLAAERLVMRGWDVALVDAREARSTAAVGLLRPIANLRDATNAQISRAAFLYALQHYRALQYDGYPLQWDQPGVLQLASGDDEARRFEAITRAQGYPAEVLQYVDAEQAAHIAGRPTRGPGWWFARGSLVSPESLAIASLARAGTGITRVARRRVDRLEREGSQWRALDAGGRVVAEAPILILANAADAKRLLPQARLALSAVRGQVTYLPPDPGRRLGAIVAGSGYVAPTGDGGYCVGATYQHDDTDESVRAGDHVGNLERAESMLPGFTSGVDARTLLGWTGLRATVPDRLPIFGAAAVEGVHVATGLGSRGLLWGPLGAELLACQLSGEPLPLSRDHMGAISPRRFLS